MSTHEHTPDELHRMPAIIQRRRTDSPVRHHRPIFYAGRMGHFANAALAGVF